MLLVPIVYRLGLDLFRSRRVAVLAAALTFGLTTYFLRPAAGSVVTVRLEVAAPGARQVSVVGDWNGWDPDRDRLVLSKGHASLLLYTVLAHRGFFSPELLDTFRDADSTLQGHPCLILLYHCGTQLTIALDKLKTL